MWLRYWIPYYSITGDQKKVTNTIYLKYTFGIFLRNFETEDHHRVSITSKGTLILDSAHDNIAATGTDCATLRPLWKMSITRGQALKTVFPHFKQHHMQHLILHRGQPQSFLEKWNFLRLQPIKEKGLAPYFLYKRPDLEKHTTAVENTIRKYSGQQPSPRRTVSFSFPLLLPATACREHIHLWRADHGDWHIPANVHQPVPVLWQWPGLWKYNRDGFLCFALNTYGLWYKHTTKGKTHLLCIIWPVGIPFPCLTDTIYNTVMRQHSVLIHVWS